MKIRKKHLYFFSIVFFFSVIFVISRPYFVFSQKPSFEITFFSGPTILNTNAAPVSGSPGTIFIITTKSSDVSGVGSVIAHIQNPDETDIALVTLYDDGAHSDGAVNDGTYGNKWDSTGKPHGTYFIDIVSNDTLGYFSEDENKASFNLVIPVENCSDNINNDGDLLIDCQDSLDCPSPVNFCSGNDLYAFACNPLNYDWEPTLSDNCSDCTCNCGNYGLANEASFCNDEKDNDCDGKIDCNDSDCSGDPVCPGPLTASITSPADGSEFKKGDNINFNSSTSGGTAPYVYSWTSDVDGNIGNTASFNKNNLSAWKDPYSITLTVTDNANATTADTINIGIYSVTAKIMQPTNNSTFTQIVDSISFQAGGCESKQPCLYSWISGIDGNIGNSQGFSKNNLSIGNHTITLTVTDTLGQSGTNQININMIAPCSPTCATGPGCRTAALINAHTTGDVCCGAGESCYGCDTGFNWNGSNCEVVAPLTATITSPPDEDAFSKGDLITFNSSVSGGVPPYIYVWKSNIDGNIGNSQTFNKNDLSVGDHIITLTVTDALAKTNTATIDIHIPPDSFDWRNVNGKDWMTSVKTQKCGDCWAFATVGSMEAKYNIEQNDPTLDTDLSEEYLLDCWAFGSCSGGGSAVGFIRNIGIAEETCYPYVGADSSCPATCNNGSVIGLWKVANWGVAIPKPAGDKADLQYALIKHGPLYVEIDTTPLMDSGKDDKDGCPIYNCGPGVPDHAVALVGYDNINQYWLIKNSYGANPSLGPCYDGYEGLNYGTCLVGTSAVGSYVAGILPSPIPSPMSYPISIPFLTLKYFPTKDGITIDTSITADIPAGTTINQMRTKTNDLQNKLIAALEKGSIYHGYKNPSAGSSLDYYVVDTKEFLTETPKVTGGLLADYFKIMSNLNICDYVENKGVKEVWIWGYAGQIQGWESNMSSSYGDISNSTRNPNDLPLCKKTYTVYHYNYGRDYAMALENHDHQVEHVLNWVDGRDITPADQWPNLLFWGKFVGRDQYNKILPPVSACGWTHSPPNTEKDYDWYNKTAISSDCEDWKPDRTGQKKLVNCETWTGNGTCSDGGGGDSFKIWWMQNIPGQNNNLIYNGKKLKNWWDFIGDFDRAMKTGKSLVY